MPARLRVTWARVRDSLWFVPGLMTAAAALLAFATVRLDAALLAQGRADLLWVFSGGTEGARGVLSAIAGSLITVTGVVFSVTVVALQLASSQFTPRVLRQFMADRTSQAVLGVFIGTFTYTLLVLRSVRSGAEDGMVFVPSLSVTMAIGLALLSIAFLIVFIDHSARSIRASSIINRVADDALLRVDRLFPDPIGQAAKESPTEPGVPPAEPGSITAQKGGYLQSVDEDALFDLAREGCAALRMEKRIGEFVLPGETVVSVWPAEAADDRASKMVRRAFVLGEDRTAEQDLEYDLIQLVDIALKGLSPGVNDPTTAKTCIDRLAQILVVLGNRAMPETRRTDGDGRLLFVARRTTFGRCVELAFRQIRHFGVGVPSVAIHLLETMGRVVALVPASRRGHLLREATLVLAAARRQVESPDDLRDVEEAGKGLSPVPELGWDRDDKAA